MKAESPDIIIIIGAARSGTKFLRDILAVPDRIKPVPYDVNYVWRYGLADHPDDILQPDALTPKKRAFIQRTIKSLASADSGDIIIEKTVSNTLRVPFVDAVFPQARFIHLVRDGRDVSESAMRLWQAPPDWKALRRKLRDMPLSNIPYVFWFLGNFLSGLGRGRKGGNVWGPRFKGIETIAKNAPLIETCALQWKHSVESASAALAQLSPDRVFEIRYEDLVSNASALQNLLGKLALPEPEKIMQAWEQKLRPGRPARWQELPMHDQEVLLNTLAPTLRDKGYITP